MISSTLIRMKLCLILLSAVLLHTEAKVQFRDIGVTLCSETEKESMYGLDGEEKWHADLRQEKGVMTLPEFADPVRYSDGAYDVAVANQAICKENLAICKEAFKYPPEPKDAPRTSIYSKSDVELGFQNTLICYITGFYPPHVTVTWTRNNIKVTNKVTLSRHYLTSDGTFNLVSHLSFTPEQGDTYTCTVEHMALSGPLTKIWDVEDTLPNVGPSVLLGVGLTIGLLGAAAGTVLIIKGNRCN